MCLTMNIKHKPNEMCIQSTKTAKSQATSTIHSHYNHLPWQCSLGAAACLATESSQWQPRQQIECQQSWHSVIAHYLSHSITMAVYCIATCIHIYIYINIIINIHMCIYYICIYVYIYIYWSCRNSQDEIVSLSARPMRRTNSKANCSNDGYCHSVSENPLVIGSAHCSVPC